MDAGGSERLLPGGSGSRAALATSSSEGHGPRPACDSAAAGVFQSPLLAPLGAGPSEVGEPD
eukprot:4819514-Pyramimonas_sp.AAC.1